MLLTDTHCHLDFHAFDDDRQTVIERARQAGIAKIVIPAIDLETADHAIRLSEACPEVYAAVGFHPNDLTTWSEASIPNLEKLAQHPKVVAIGEIGLDDYRDRTPRPLQREAFRAQLELARRVGKPVIIHTREATEDTLAILSEWRANFEEAAPQRVGIPLGVEHPLGVLHSFQGDESAAWRAIQLGFLIGITGPVTFKNAQKLQALVKVLPLSHLLIETDAPFLAPHPHRGQRNEPAYVRHVAEKIAEIHGLPLETVAEQTTRNAAALFGWRD